MSGLKYNIYERNGSGANGLIKINSNPVTLRVAELLKRKREEKAKRNQFFIIIPYKRKKGQEIHSMRTY